MSQGRVDVVKFSRWGWMCGVVLLCIGMALAADSDTPVDGTSVPAATITYSVDKPSVVSINIYNQDGQVVRELLHTAERDAGEHREVWDGLDSAGTPVAPGKYQWKLLSSQGIRAQWKTTLGNTLNPPWQLMPGNYSGTERVAVDDEGNIYLAGASAESCPWAIKVTPDGKRLWASDHLMQHGNTGGAGIADGKMIMLQSNSKVTAYDAATGVGVYTADQGWFENDGWGTGRDSMNLAARGDQVVVCHQRRNIVRWVNPADGSKIDETTVKAPLSLTFDPQGNVLAGLADGTIVRISRENKTPVVVVPDAGRPFRIDCDKTSGEIFVLDEKTTQIKRFSPDGKLLKTYGKEGGRGYGPYDPSSFKDLREVKSDGKGGFIVTEVNAPRRTAFFDADGNCYREWFGGLGYSNYGVIDEQDVTTVWMYQGGMSSDIVKCKVDYTTGVWKTEAVYEFPKPDDPEHALTHGMFQIRHLNGRTYACVLGPLMVLILDESNNKFVPVVQAAGKFYWGNSYNFSKPLHEMFYGGPLPEPLPKWTDVPDHQNKAAYFWTDKNFDGHFQHEEMSFTGKTFKTIDPAPMWADHELNFYAMDDRPKRLKCLGFDENGVPQYGSWENWEPVGDRPTDFNPEMVFFFNGKQAAPTSDGGIVGYFNNSENPQGMGFFADKIGANYVVKWNADGKVAWRVGSHSKDLGCKPGEARTFRLIAGLVHDDCVIISEWEQSHERNDLLHVWDKDGLFVGQALSRPDLSVAPQEAYHLAVEHWSGSAVQITEKNVVPGLEVGDVVIMLGYINASPIFRLSGWDTMRRQQGSITITPEQSVAAEAEATRQAAARASAGKRQPRLERAIAVPKVDQPPTIDGKLDEACWSGAPQVESVPPWLDRRIPVRPGAETQAWLCQDEKNLYIAIRCGEPFLDRLRTVCNSPTDGLFKDDSVELFFDLPGRDKRPHNQIVVTAKAVASVCDAYNPDASRHIEAAAGREEKAYLLELAIPWDQLNGHRPAEGESFGFNLCRDRHTEGTHELYSWADINGQMFHNPPLFARAFVGDKIAPEAAARAEGRAFIRKLPPGNFALDGKMEKWRHIRPIQIFDTKEAVADLYLGYRDDGIYATFDVKTTSPWRNKAAYDYAFNGGASVDLMIGPMRDDPAALVPGDVRMLAAPINGKDTLIEFQPLLSADLGSDDAAPRTYETPSQGKEPFARVAVLPEGSVKVVPKTNGPGYIVEMRIPVRAPLKLASGQRMRFDASVILANTAGTSAQARYLWFSAKPEDMTVAADAVLEVRMRPANWGIAELE